MSAFISSATAPAPACTSTRTALCDHNLWVNVDVPGLPMYFVPSSASVGNADEPATRSIPTTPATPQLSVSTPLSPSSRPATSSTSISSQPPARASAFTRIPASSRSRVSTHPFTHITRPAAASTSTHAASSATARAPFSVSIPASNPTGAPATTSTPTLASTSATSATPFSTSPHTSTSATAPPATTTNTTTSRPASASFHASTHASTSTTAAATFSIPPPASTTATAPSPNFVSTPPAQPKELQHQDKHSTAEVAGVKQHTRKVRPLFAHLRLRSPRSTEAQDAKKPSISTNGRRGVHIATAPSTGTATVNPGAATPVAVDHVDVGTRGDEAQEPGTPVTPCTGDDGVSQDRTAATPRGRRLRTTVSGGLKSAGSAVKRVLLSPGRRGRGPHGDEGRKEKSGTDGDGSIHEQDVEAREDGAGTRSKTMEKEEKEKASTAATSTAKGFTSEEESQRAWMRCPPIDGEEVYEGGLLRRASLDLGAETRHKNRSRQVQHIPGRRADDEEIVEIPVHATEGGAGDAVVVRTVEAVGAGASDAARVDAKGAEEDGVRRAQTVKAIVAGSAKAAGDDAQQGGKDEVQRVDVDDAVGADALEEPGGSTVEAEQPRAGREGNWVHRLRARVRGRRDAESRTERGPRKWPWVRRGAARE